MGNYRKNIYFGRDSEGKEIRKNIRANSKAELERKIYEAKKDFEENSNPTKVTWGVYSSDWLKTYKSIKEQSTYDMYQTALDKLSDLDHLPVKDLTTDDIQRCVNKHKQYPVACSRIKLAVDQIFAKAVKEGIVRAINNPADDVEYPKKKTQNANIRVLTEEEKNILPEIRKAEYEPTRLLILLLQAFGLRPQEVVPLQAKDFDFPKKRLTINKAVRFVKNQPEVKTTKNEKVRQIPIPDAVVAELKIRTDAMTDQDYIIQIEPGQMITKSWYRDQINRVKKSMEVKLKHKLDPGFTPYSFRHSYATYTLYYNGVKLGKMSIKMAAYIMGHSEQVFVQTYSHLLEDLEKQEEVINSIQGI